MWRIKRITRSAVHTKFCQLPLNSSEDGACDGQTQPIHRAFMLCTCRETSKGTARTARYSTSNKCRAHTSTQHSDVCSCSGTFRSLYVYRTTPPCLWPNLCVFRNRTFFLAANPILNTDFSRHVGSIRFEGTLPIHFEGLLSHKIQDPTYKRRLCHSCEPLVLSRLRGWLEGEQATHRHMDVQSYARVSLPNKNITVRSNNRLSVKKDAH